MLLQEDNYRNEDETHGLLQQDHEALQEDADCAADLEQIQEVTENSADSERGNFDGFGLKKSSKTPRKTVYSQSLLTYCDLFSESLSPMLVLLPVMFVHVGIGYGTLLLLVSALLQAVTARLILESTRL